MSKLTRTLALSGVALVVALALATPAAANGVKAVCLVTGTIKVQDKQDASLGVRLIGGKGFFRFSSVFTECWAMAKGTPEIIGLEVEASGFYNSQFCGVGKAWGTIDDLVDAPPKWQGLVEGDKFSIHFHALNGWFFWHHDDFEKERELPDLKASIFDGKTGGFGDKQDPQKTWEYGGALWITPARDKAAQLPNTPPGNCAKGFDVEGVIVIDTL